MTEETEVQSQGPTPSPAYKLTKGRSWYQRHQSAMAVIGTILALTSYVLKERVAETWQRHASNLREATEAVAREQQAATMAYNIGKVHAGVNALFDTARLEQKHRSHKTNGEEEPELPLANSTLDEDLDVTLPLANEQQSALAKIGSLLPVDNPERQSLESLGRTLSSISSRYIAEKSGGKPPTLALLADMQALTLRQGLLRISLEAQANADQDRDERRAALVSILIDVLFVVGLLLSLIGKLGGVDSEPLEA